MAKKRRNRSKKSEPGQGDATGQERTPASPAPQPVPAETGGQQIVSSLSALTLADTGCVGGETGTPDASDQPIASSTSASQPAASMPSAQDLASQIETELDKKIEKQFERKVERRPFPKRPGPVTIGYPLKLLTNHFRIRVGSKVVYHYDVEMEEKKMRVEADPNVVDRDVADAGPIQRRQNVFTRKLATVLKRKIFVNMIRAYSQTVGQVFRDVRPVYDGNKSMYVTSVLRGTEGGQAITLQVALGEKKVYLVTIKLAETNYRIDLSIINSYHQGLTCDEEALKKSVQIIDIVLRHNASIEWLPVGLSVYDPEGGSMSLRASPHLKLMYGYYTSMRNLMIGPTLNVDRSAAVFFDWSTELMRLIENILKLRTPLTRVPVLSDFQRRQVNRELRDLKVEATHLSYGGHLRSFTFVGLSRETAKTSKFDWIEKEGSVTEKKGKVTVEEYFRRKYRITLKGPHLPLLDVGSRQKPNKMPMELCRLVKGQRLNSRSLTNQEKSEVTEKSADMKPNDRLLYAQDFVIRQFIEGPVADKNKPFLLDFGIDINKKLIELESRVIPAPKLKYFAKNFQPVDGEWDMFKLRAKFFKAASLRKWIVIDMSFKDNFSEDEISDFVDAFVRNGAEKGMGGGRDGRPALPCMKLLRFGETNFNTKEKMDWLRQQISAKQTLKDLQMILVFKCSQSHPLSNEIYAHIKKLGDVHKGLVTQCVQIDKIWNDRQNRRLWNTSYLSKLMLKVNVKLGGTNVVLDPSCMPSLMENNKKSLMIVGADVNHPAPADRIPLSIAGLVASYDEDYAKYFPIVSMQQRSRQEMIEKLDDMMADVLMRYQKKNKLLPSKIVFYRDGVSESQFQQVIDNEWVLLRQAFQRFAGYNPKVTFIVVQKRHHTRFMVEKTGKNIPPGTVVDQTVTNKNDFDFYLKSHPNQKGTARPSHYYVLADDNGFTADDMSLMTYYLCHLYQRCTSSVSIPAPVYYAHLAAFRAKVHAYTVLRDGSDSASLSSGQSGDRPVEVDMFTDAINVNESQRENLYFM